MGSFEDGGNDAGFQALVDNRDGRNNGFGALLQEPGRYGV